MEAKELDVIEGTRGKSRPLKGLVFCRPSVTDYNARWCHTQESMWWLCRGTSESFRRSIGLVREFQGIYGMTKAFVAVHVGAGRHCRSTEPALKQLCAITCTTTMKSLQKGQTAIDAAEIAVKLLENHPGTNAGIGSSLNWDGKVECDAAMMDGCSGRFACIGAVPSIRHEQIVETYAIDVKNPVSLARRVLDDQNRHGRLVNPIIICGPGAWRAAQDYNLETYNHWEPLSGPMVTEGAVRRYKANRESLDNTAPFNPVALSEPHDTVGSVVLDSVGNLAVAVSTGGISLKRAGRVGDTAIPGSGFWLNQYTLNDQFRIACCTTGTGEQLIETDFARSYCNELFARREEDRSQVITHFLQAFNSKPFDRHPAAGFISLIIEEACIGEFWYGFTTESMGIGYMSASDSQPTALVDRRTAESDLRVVGSSF